jgi:hypothetical protein
MHKVGARCAGCSDGDAQQPGCFFSLITLLLLCFFPVFKILLLKSSFLFFKVSFLRLVLSHVFFDLF